MYTKHLSEVLRPTRFQKSQRSVRGKTHQVVERCVRAELRASPPTRPRFGRGHQRTSRALPPSGRHDIPTFEIAHVPGSAAVDNISNRQFHKSDGHVVFECDEHFGGLPAVTGEKTIDFHSVAVRLVWPQSRSHLEPRAPVGRDHRTNV